MNSTKTHIKSDDQQLRDIFRALHHESKAFVIPNPWDIGSSKLLESMGFKALATTSAGFAFSQGKGDNHIDRETMLTHVASIVKSTHLPVSADLENGYGDAPEKVAETISKAIDIGLAGASIEDARGKPLTSIYSIELAADRIRAATEVAKPARFVLTARAENFLCGNPDIKDTIKRLQAYQEAGADVLYAPGLTNKQDIQDVVSSVDLPVNVVMGLQGITLTVDELSALGVKRISVGSALARAAFGALKRAAEEMNLQGSFAFAQQAMPFAELHQLMEGRDNNG